jgi:hypothetical protein
MIAHIVLFEPKRSKSEADRREFLKSIRSTARAIESVRSARVGKIFELGVMPNNEVGSTTYSFGAILEFGTKEDLRAYVADPRHDELRRLFWDMCEGTLIADVDLVDVQSPTADSLV